MLLAIPEAAGTFTNLELTMHQRDADLPALALVGCLTGSNSVGVKEASIGQRI